MRTIPGKYAFSLKDVTVACAIVLPTCQTRSLAQLLAGGDEAGRGQGFDQILAQIARLP